MIKHPCFNLDAREGRILTRAPQAYILLTPASFNLDAREGRILTVIAEGWEVLNLLCFNLDAREGRILTQHAWKPALVGLVLGSFNLDAREGRILTSRRDRGTRAGGRLFQSRRARREDSDPDVQRGQPHH